MSRHPTLPALLALLLTASPATSATWRQLSPGNVNQPLARSGHFMVLDAPGRRLVVWGDRLPVGEIWTLSLDGPALWTRVQTQGTPPAARVLGAAIFDPVRRRMILFGGGVNEGTIAWRNDVWALSLDGVPTWTELHPQGQLPDPRQMHAAIYDAPRDRMIVFGGISSVNPPYVTYENSVWALSLGDSPEWTKLAPTGTPPDWRNSSSLVYDAAGDRAVMFGGNNYLDNTTPYRNDTWALSLAGTTAWTRLTTSGGPPSGRYEHVAVMDELRHRMLVFGGRGLNTVANNETWALSLGGGVPSWTRLGTTTIVARYMCAGVLDPPTDRLIVDGGNIGSARMAETVTMSLAGPPAWQVLSPAGPPLIPPARLWASPLVDPVTDRLLIQSGYDFTSTVWTPGDLWSLALGDPTAQWADEIPAGSIAFAYGAVILDPPRRRQMRFFSGPTGVEVMPLDALGPWAPLSATGAAPPQRYGFSLAYDSARDRILLCGGYKDDPRGHSRYYFADIWALSPADPPSWQQIHPDDGLVHLNDDGLAYDAPGDQLVGVGWKNGVGWMTFLLPADGSSDWRPIEVTPGVNGLNSIALDPSGRQLIGIDLTTMGAWRLPLDGSAGWTPLTLAGTPPPGRQYTRLAFDDARHRVLLFGGQLSTPLDYRPLDDLWALELDQPVPAAVSLASADASPGSVRLRWWSALRTGTVATLESRRAETVWTSVAEIASDGQGMFSYQDTNVVPGDRVGYRLASRGTPWPTSEVWVTVPARPVLALAGGRPNPSSGPPRIVFTLGGADPARLELFDLGGRRLESLEVGALGAGEHSLPIGSGLAPGVYVARLTQGGRALTARLAITR